MSLTPPNGMMSAGRMFAVKIEKKRATFFCDILRSLGAVFYNVGAASAVQPDPFSPHRVLYAGSSPASPPHFFLRPASRFGRWPGPLYSQKLTHPRKRTSSSFPKQTQNSRMCIRPGPLGPRKMACFGRLPHSRSFPSRDYVQMYP